MPVSDKAGRTEARGENKIRQKNSFQHKNPELYVNHYGLRRGFFSPVCGKDLQLSSYSKGKKGIPQIDGY